MIIRRIPVRGSDAGAFEASALESIVCSGETSVMNLKILRPRMASAQRLTAGS
jgi:hypothetical protein